MSPRGCNSATRPAGRSWRTIWQKTFCSRTRRAISWPYCEPKSKIRTRSLSCNGVTLLNRFRSFRLGPCGEQFFEHGVAVNPPVAAEPLDVHSAVLEEIDLPVLAGGEGQHRQGAFAVVLQPVADLGLIEALEEGQQPVKWVALHLLNLRSVRSLRMVWNPGSR